MTVNGTRAWAAVGVALALGCPFINFNALPDLGLASLAESSEVLPSIVVKVGVSVVLAAIAFGIQRRSLTSLRIRPFGWRDLGATVVTLASALVLALFAVATLVRFAHSASFPSNTAADASLTVRVISVLATGIGEEFIFRGCLIEQLGDLAGSRRIAGVVSVIGFAVAHSRLSVGRSGCSSRRCSVCRSQSSISGEATCRCACSCM